MSYVRSEEHKQKMSEMQKKRFFENPSLASNLKVLKMGNPSRRGYVASKETLRKRSETMKRKIASGEIVMPTGKNHPFWKGGRFVNSMGYVSIQCKDHPRRSEHGYVLEHILVMEKEIGRYVTKEEVVHHIDGNKSNNSISNLMLFKNDSEHRKFHHKMSRLGQVVYAFLRKEFNV